MYIVYLPKSKGEKKEDRKINNILEWYVTNSDNNYSLILAPGYLSTTEKSIKKLLMNSKKSHHRHRLKQLIWAFSTA